MIKNEISMDWVKTARLNAAEIEKGHMVDYTGEEPALLRGLADKIEAQQAEIERLQRTVENARWLLSAERVNEESIAHLKAYLDRAARKDTTS